MLSREVAFESKKTSSNVLTLVPPGPMHACSQWIKIVQFLEGAKKNSSLAGGGEDKIDFMKNKAFLKECMLIGVQTGEFDPQYPIELVAEMIAVFIEGCKRLSEESLKKQVELIKAQMKEILLVL